MQTWTPVELPVDDGRIHAEHTGDPTADAVLLLHAGVADGRVWDEVFDPLAGQGFHVLRYDMRGYGRSAPATAPHSQVADAFAVLDAAGIARAHFVGLSQGAATSVDAALAEPARVASLTLVAPGLTGFEWPRLPGFAERMAAAEAGDAHGLALATAKLWAPLSFTREGDHDPAARIVLDQAEQFMRDEQEVEEPAATGRLGEITAPTLVVLGDRDVEPVAEIGRLLVAGVPGARAVTVADADHLLPLRQPARLVELVTAHLRAVEAQLRP